MRHGIPGRRRNAPRLWPELQQTIGALSEEPDTAPLLLSGIVDDDKRAWLEARGCLVFREPGHAVEAVATLAHAAALEDSREACASAGTYPLRATQADLLRDVPPGATALSEYEAMRLLADAGVPVAPHGLARDADEAVRIAEDLGYPVVVKLCSRDILHKSDVGGVALNLADAPAVRDAFGRAWRRLLPAYARTAVTPSSLMACWSRAVRGWGEVMVGVRRDPVFGLVALAGIGGTAVEIFRQTACGLRRCRANRRAPCCARAGPPRCAKGTGAILAWTWTLQPGCWPACRNSRRNWGIGWIRSRSILSSSPRKGWWRRTRSSRFARTCPPPRNERRATRHRSKDARTDGTCFAVVPQQKRRQACTFRRTCGGGAWRCADWARSP
ncbi:hypothetical protein AWV80_40360 [Cupriavidus sp. UYMU48A]|nr:hypothetical protein AWV80_40360 [Cupriavidus sp. UYMU48A]